MQVIVSPSQKLGEHASKVWCNLHESLATLLPNFHRIIWWFWCSVKTNLQIQIGPTCSREFGETLMNGLPNYPLLSKTVTAYLSNCVGQHKEQKLLARILADSFLLYHIYALFVCWSKSRLPQLKQESCGTTQKQESSTRLQDRGAILARATPSPRPSPTKEPTKQTWWMSLLNRIKREETKSRQTTLKTCKDAYHSPVFLRSTFQALEAAIEGAVVAYKHAGIALECIEMPQVVMQAQTCPTIQNKLWFSWIPFQTAFYFHKTCNIMQVTSINMFWLINPCI